MASEWNDSLMQQEIRAILQQHSDQLDDITPRSVRFQLEQRMGYVKDELEPRKKEIAQAIKIALAEMEGPVKAEPAAAAESSSVISAPAPSFSALSSSGAPRSLESQRALNAQKKRALESAAASSRGGANNSGARRIDEEDDFNEYEEEEPNKRQKMGMGSGVSAASSRENGGSSDPNTVNLGQSKRVQVSKFKNMVLIDIRETYIDKTSGEERPGKKGISLKPDQWEQLIKHAGKINAAIARMG